MPLTRELPIVNIFIFIYIVSNPLASRRWGMEASTREKPSFTGSKGAAEFLVIAGIGLPRMLRRIWPET